jgi:Rrf2 family nitric oxide-sensitive transcriptional repressor
MRLTRYTDYALRTLLHLAARPEAPCSVASIARAQRVSQNHLVKVAHELTRAGYVATLRGRTGGLRLARAAEHINIGAVVRHMEADFTLADCPGCIIAPACGLSSVLNDALGAFLAVLDRHSLADLVAPRQAALRRLLAAD